MATCPDGHRSDTDDYCSVCGLAMAAGAPTPAATEQGGGGGSATATPAATEQGGGGGSAQARCSNCDEPHGPDDVFCENCGLDFLTGTLPGPTSPVTSHGAATAAPSGDTVQLRVEADRAFHARMDTDGVLEYPEPEPDPRLVTVAGDRVLIGRERPSRGIFPDVDLTSDPAASSRHALLQRRADGSWTVTDLGSTNGTFVGDSTVPITPHEAVPVATGTPIFVGAWTRLEITQHPPPPK